MQLRKKNFSYMQSKQNEGFPHILQYNTVVPGINKITGNVVETSPCRDRDFPVTPILMPFDSIPTDS